MSIKFDIQSMLADLKVQLILAMKQLQEELLNESKQKMLTPNGKDDLTAEQITDIANVISAGIVGGAWAAMDEWGTGSKMAIDNPALGKYRNSKMWNPARGDLVIRSRPNKAGQIDIFGNAVNGKGKGGVDLEAIGIVTPQLPSRAIQTALRWMKNGRMRKVIQNTIYVFPFGNYLKTDLK